MSISRARLLGSIGVFLVVFATSVPVAEMVFRLIGDTPSYDLQGLYVPFGRDSYKLGALVNTDALWTSGRIGVHTDELGLRSDAERRHGAKPGDTIDVMVIGDSQGFGNGLNFEDSLAGSLAEIAARDGYRVANTSVGGHSLATQLALLRWLLQDQKLTVSHVLVLMTPVMMKSCDQETHAIVGQDGRLYGETITTGTRLRLWMKTHVVLYSRIRDALRNYGIGVDPAKASPSVFDFYRSGQPETETRNALQACATALVDEMASREVMLHIVYLPSVVEADFESVRQAARDRGLELDPDVPFRTYSSITARFGLEALDLRPTFHQIRAEGHLLNVRADFHYSAALSRAVSARVWTSLHLPARSRTQ